MDNLYKLVDGEISIHNALLNNKNIKALIRRDRGGLMEGDANGSNKLRAFAELGLVWYMVNINSPGIQKGLSGKELETEGKRFYNIPDNWKADEIYTAVLNDYIEIYESNVLVNAIKNVLKGFNMASNLVEKLNLAMERYRDNQTELDIDNVNEIIKLNSSIMNIANDLPNQVKKLKDLEESYLKEEKTANVARGGLKVTSSMVRPR